jgi:hypothetical protein
LLLPSWGWQVFDKTRKREKCSGWKFSSLQQKPVNVLSIESDINFSSFHLRFWCAAHEAHFGRRQEERSFPSEGCGIEKLFCSLAAFSLPTGWNFNSSSLQLAIFSSAFGWGSEMGLPGRENAFKLQLGEKVNARHFVYTIYMKKKTSHRDVKLARAFFLI